MPTLEQELELYKQRTNNSFKCHEDAKNYLPLGVTSNFRCYEPYPLFIKSAQGSTLIDEDDNEYIDFAMHFGTLLVGHAHPKIIKTVSEQTAKGTLYNLPHKAKVELVKELCRRYPIDMVRFVNTGTEATMHSIRLARSITGKNKIIKMEGSYHGAHDALIVSTKPPVLKMGREEAPFPVCPTTGIPADVLKNTLIASFNRLDSIERLLQKYEHEVAAVILEPVMLNIGVCVPVDNFLQKLIDLCHSYNVLVIFDEVKTGFKLASGGACEYYKAKPDIICLAKAMGGGLPIGCFGGRKEIMNHIASPGLYHAGTYSGNPLSIATAITTLKEILTDDAYLQLISFSQRLKDGYTEIINKNKLNAHSLNAGAVGVIYFNKEQVRNYRDYLRLNYNKWRHYWIGMVNRGIMPQPHGQDDQWTESVQHTGKDIEKHLEVFEEIAPDLKDD